MKKDNSEPVTFYPPNIAAWRQWLLENHRSAPSVWLVFYKKKSGMPSITWSEAVDEALCFGWIDSKAIPQDEEKYLQFFSQRKPKSTWSKVNKDKIQQLVADGRMTQAGWDVIERAKQNGSWTILDEVEAMIIPEDLALALKAQPEAMDFFLSLSKSVRKAMLSWPALAKRAETRQQRIQEIATLAAQKLKPKQF